MEKLKIEVQNKETGESDNYWMDLQEYHKERFFRKYGRACTNEELEKMMDATVVMYYGSNTGSPSIEVLETHYRTELNSEDLIVNEIKKLQYGRK